MSGSNDIAPPNAVYEEIRWCTTCHSDTNHIVDCASVFGRESCCRCCELRPKRNLKRTDEIRSTRDG